MDLPKPVSIKYLHPVARERHIIGRLLVLMAVVTASGVGSGFIWGHFVGYRDAHIFLGGRLRQSELDRKACEQSFWGKLMEPRKRDY